MATRNINLTDQLDAYVEERVSSGAYQNASEMMRAALRSLRREEEEHGAKIARIRAEIQIGLDQIERGETVLVDDLEVWADSLGRGRFAR